MVDLGGYIIILMNDNGKIKLYGSSADNADNPEVGDEILEVNGRTLDNATDAEVSQYIHQCIKSGTISLQVTRRTGNKMKELDGPNADRIRDAWVIALERGARERLQKLPALRKIQPRDIQAILHQQITDGSASTSTEETPKKDVTNSHITVTLADREAASRNAVPAKLSNGTVPKGVAKENEDTKDRKDILEKQRSCPDETNLLQPVPGVRIGERRASSPFQNGRTEVLIGEPEGTPRSPRGSTSSATNDANLLIPPGDPDYPESIYKSRRRSTSGVNDIHLQPSQLQENNNGDSRDNVKGGGGGESRDSRVESTGGPNEMWAPGSSPGHNRELPVDVPDSLLQQAYANKQVMSLMLNRSETAFWSASTSPRNRRHLTTDEADDTCIGNRRASDHEISDNDHHHHLHHHHNHEKRHQSNRLSLNVKTSAVSTIACVDDNDTTSSGFVDTDRVDNSFDVPTRVGDKDDNQNDRQRSDKDKTLARIIEMNVLNENEMAATLANNKMSDEKRTASATSADEDQKPKVTIPLEKIHPLEITDDEDEVVTSESPSLSSVTRNGVSPPTAILMQKETSVDADEDYPFAKEDYPTMLKTCSDDSASPRSSSGRSDSTALLDSSLIMAGKESPLYDARRIDLGSPCRPLVPEIKIAPIFTRGRETTSFDNPAYGLADLHDLHQGLLMRSDEVTDLTRLIDEQQSIANGRKSRPNEKTSTSSPRWSTPAKEHTVHRQPIKSETTTTTTTTTRPSEPTKTKKKSTSKRQNEAERLKSRGSRDSADLEIDSEGLLGAGSTDDLLSGELTNLTITRSNRKKKGQQLHSSSGYSTLRSDASIGEFSDRQPDRSFLVVGNRSYREVAVDCPPDFVPVTKCHPVYPPPNKTDNTIERNSTIHNLQMDRLSRHVDETTTFCPEYGRRDSASNLRLNWYARDTSLKKNASESRNAKDEKSLDRGGNTMTIQHEEQRQRVKADDVRNNEVVSDLGGMHETRREKVRSRVKSRVLRYKARLSSIGRKSPNTLVHASSGKDGKSSKARIFAKHSFTASSNNSSTNACKITTSYSDTTTGRSGLEIFSNNQSVSSNESFYSSKYSNSQGKLGLRAQNDYVNDRIPRRRSILNLMQRETNENSRNSLLEFVGRRDSTPVIVHYSSTIDNAFFVDNELRRSTIDNDYRVNDRTNETKVFSCVDGVELHDQTVRLENTQNSLLSLEYRRHIEDNDVTKDNDELSICKKLFDDSTSSEDTEKFIKKCLSETNLYRDNNDEKFIIETRTWLSEPYLDLDRFTRNFTIYDFIEKRAKTNEFTKMGETVLTRQDVNDDETKAHRETMPQPGLNGVKPAIPPRDQKRAPARPPKDNIRLSTRNNNIEQTDNANTPELTQQQLHSIRKYQEQFRKRKEGDERQEYLNRSLRDSRKLQALESHTTTLPGQENPAYSQDEVTSTTPRSTHGTPGQTTPREVEEPPKVLTYGEVVATLERLQLQLRDLSGALGISGPGVEAELEAVRTLLVQRRFATALATHHALRTRLRTGKPLKHHDDDASNLARDCVEVLEEWQTTNVGSGETRTMVEELTVLLTSYEIEGLLLAHDSIVSYVDGIQRKASPSSSSPSRSPSPSSSLRGTRNTDNIKIIRIEKTNEPLGATVRNEGDAVIIGRVVRGGAADKSGLFHEGDEVLEVNGVEMRGKSVNEVCDILAGMQGGLTFLVLPASANQRNNVTNTRREDSAQIHHVRAHFDYDPEEDPYIPCRELGVSFQKGDVLHVISQEDSNWWQAYREGEEDHTLAGLIPSRAFQHQRESIKQTFAGGKSTIRSSKKSSTLLCTRKNPKKKKKRAKFGSNFNDEGYPLYTTATIDDYDSEEVLTYEEVALYYPRANHKRPIVLIGPPNIGRHELRQRLMQDSERFAAAIPHTSRPRKGSEVDGQDYHFISRSQFESDILGRKFVEHGEYEKAYYGTSVEAIRSVVNSGKICVLNLHPQSLKILRGSDLKPYVVFVAPPSLEKLRQKRIKNNESFKEEELKDIIEKAREMEDKYGHLFDMIILNNDTDRAYNQLLGEINSLEREPQWVPATWVQ